MMGARRIKLGGISFPTLARYFPGSWRLEAHAQLETGSYTAGSYTNLPFPNIGVMPSNRQHTLIRI